MTINKKRADSMEPERHDEDMYTQPETPVVTKDTPVSEEDPNEYLLSDDELGVDEVEIEESDLEED